jgi:YD repeat-containing protein
LISERESAFIPYQKSLRKPKRKGNAVFRVNPRLKEKRMTNVCQSGISGSTNLMNWKALHQGFWSIYTGNGTKRLYAKEYHLSTEQSLQLKLPSTWALALTLETLPNGNQLRFKYDEIHNKVRLTQITAYNRTGRGIIDQLNFHYKKGQCEVTNLAGLNVMYEQNDAQLSGNAVKILTKVDSSQKSTYHYQSNEDEKSLRIEKIEKPKG